MTQTRILVVEDEQRIREAIVTLLTQRGFEVAAADSVTTALKIATAQSFQLAILDLSLADGSGMVVLDRLLQNRIVRPRVVVLSASMDIALRATCYRRGAADFVAKPFHPEELVRRVERLLGGTPVSSHTA